MHRPLTLLTLALAAFTVPVATARAQVTLKPRFEPGKFRQETVAKGEQQFKTPAADLSGTSDITVVSSIEVGKPNEQGDFEVSHATLSMKGKLVQQGETVDFDSKNPDGNGADGPVAGAIRAIFKREFEQKPVLLVGSDGKVKEVKGILEGGFSTAAVLKDERQQLLDSFPADPVKVGDTWLRDEQMNLGQGQIFKLKRKYEYLGTTPKFATVKDSPLLDRIRFTDESIELAMREDAGMLLSVKKSELQVAESEGLLLFDRASGRIVESRHKLRVTGKAALAIMNVELAGDFNSTIETTTKELP